MRQFYEKWEEDLIWQTPSAKLEPDSKETETLLQASANNDLPAVDGIVDAIEAATWYNSLTAA